MNRTNADISVSGATWQIVANFREAQRLYDRTSPFRGALGSHDRGMLGSPISSAFEEPVLFEDESSSAVKRQREYWLHTQTWTAKMSADALITVTPIISLDVSSSQVSGLRMYQALFESLPFAKRAKLFEALSKINANVSDIELSEDGQIIIETKEGGLDCFYAICTEEGDFKGTWLWDGSLRTQSWPATPPSEDLALSLI